MGQADLGVHAAILLTAGFVVAGCSTLPPLPPIGHPSAIAQVVDRVQCEVYEAVSDLLDLKDEAGQSWVRNYVAKAVLTLQINTDGSIGPEVSLLGPLSSGTYSLGFGAGYTGAANRIATYGFNLDFSQAQKGWCHDSANSGYPPLQGELGMREWLTAVLRSHNKDDPFPRPKSMSHRLDFTMDGNVKISPAFSMTRSKGSGVFSLHRKDFHTLDIAIEYLSQKDRNAPDYNKVCVVNLPGPCFVGGVAVVQRETIPRPRTKSDESTPPGETVKPKPPAAKPPAAGRRDRPIAQPGGRSKAPRDLPPDVQQRLDRALQNLELRSIAPRF